MARLPSVCQFPKYSSSQKYTTSLVKVSAPDLEPYPRFAQAPAASEKVDVAPGDAGTLSLELQGHIRTQLIESLTTSMAAQLWE